MAWLALGSVATVWSACCNSDIRCDLGDLACAAGSPGVQLSDGNGAMGCIGHVRYVHSVWCLPWLVAYLQRFRVASSLGAWSIQCKCRTCLFIHDDGSAPGCNQSINYGLVRLDTPGTCHSHHVLDRSFHAATDDEFIHSTLIPCPPSFYGGPPSGSMAEKVSGIWIKRRQFHE